MEIDLCSQKYREPTKQSILVMEWKQAIAEFKVQRKKTIGKQHFLVG